MSSRKHIIIMVLGCAVPLLLLFFAPALGIKSNTSFFIFLVVMFGFHLLFPMHHHDSNNKTKSNNNGKD